MGKVLIQVWLKSIKKWVSYLINKWMHKKRKNSGVHASSCKPTKSVWWKWKKESRRKNEGRLKYFWWKGEYIRWLRNTRVMDIKQLQLNDSWYIEGTICLVNEWIGAKGMVFRAWVHKRHHKTRSGWYSGLVVPISSIVGLLILYSYTGNR